MERFIFTSEHVSPGHPDKVMDAVAEAVVDYVLNNSPLTKPRVAVDGLLKNTRLILAGEITAGTGIDYAKIAQDTIKKIGYNSIESPLFNDENVEVEGIFNEQSSDIAQGVDHNEIESAGDIGIMFGGAVKEAPDYTCWSHYIARLLSHGLFQRDLPFTRPDQKTQVSILYEDGIPVKITDIVCCVSHSDKISTESLREAVAERVRIILNKSAIKDQWKLNIDDYTIHINPTGKFESYGPIADSGAVGRKIVCDQYGGYFPVGGGNLNGKDSTKVDRSAVYMTRYVAKNLVKEGLADKCQIQVSYAIGMLDPISVNVETFGTENVTNEEINAYVKRFSFRPGDIIRSFHLNEPKGSRQFDYVNLGMYGHIGQRFDTEEQLPWEKV